MSLTGSVSTTAVGVDGTTATLVENVTKSGLYMASFAFDLIQKIAQRSNQGSLAIGTGGMNIGDLSYTHDPRVSADSGYHVYFYKTEGNGLNAAGLPDFLNPDMSVDKSKIVAYASSATVPDTADYKKGIVLDRDGSLEMLNPSVGLTFKWEQGYGTGEFNAVCYTSCDVMNLMNSPSYSKVFFGKQLEGLSSQPEFYYIKNGVQGITDENTMIINRRGKLYTYNLLTGMYAEYTGALTTYQVRGRWGVTQHVVDGKLYFIGDMDNYSSFFCSLNLSTLELVQGKELGGAGYVAVYGYNLILKDGKVYVAFPGNSDGIICRQYAEPTIRSVENTITFAVPVKYTGYYTLTSYGSEYYLLTNQQSGITYRIMDFATPDTSCDKAFFTGSDVVAPILIGSKVQLAGVTSYGLMNSMPTKNGLSFNKNASILDSECTPVLSYGKFSATFNKQDTSELTSTHAITSLAVTL